MAQEIIHSLRLDSRPLKFTPIGETWRGEKVTTTEASRLVREVREWAEQFDNPDAHKLVEAMKGFDRLFATVWTEIDESLVRLSLAKHCHDAEKAAEHLSIAMKYLNRWQDRGGRIGNVG